MKETDQQNYEFDRIDDLIHSRVRLATMAYLSGAGTADFKAIKSAVKATDGNISVHLRKLEDAGYLVSIKQFNGRKPQTLSFVKAHVEPASPGRQRLVNQLLAK